LSYPSRSDLPVRSHARNAMDPGDPGADGPERSACCVVLSHTLPPSVRGTKKDPGVARVCGTALFSTIRVTEPPARGPRRGLRGFPLRCGRWMSEGLSSRFSPRPRTIRNGHRTVKCLHAVLTCRARRPWRYRVRSRSPPLSWRWFSGRRAAEPGTAEGESTRVRPWGWRRMPGTASCFSEVASSVTGDRDRNPWPDRHQDCRCCSDRSLRVGDPSTRKLARGDMG
jgi:hypothetical protein